VGDSEVETTVVVGGVRCDYKHSNSS